MCDPSGRSGGSLRPSGGGSDFGGRAPPPTPIPELEPVPALDDDVLAKPVAYGDLFPFGLGSVETLAMREFPAKNIPRAALWGMITVLTALLAIAGAYWRAMRQLRRTPRRVRRTVRLIASI